MIEADNVTTASDTSESQQHGSESSVSQRLVLKYVRPVFVPVSEADKKRRFRADDDQTDDTATLNSRHSPKDIPPVHVGRMGLEMG